MYLLFIKKKKLRSVSCEWRGLMVKWNGVVLGSKGRGRERERERESKFGAWGEMEVADVDSVMFGSLHICLYIHHLHLLSHSPFCHHSFLSLPRHLHCSFSFSIFHFFYILYSMFSQQMRFVCKVLENGFYF